MRTFYNPGFVILAGILIGAGLAAFAVLCNAMVPDFVRRARDQAAQRTGRAFLIGLINFVFFGLIALALLSARSLPLRGVGVIMATIVLTFVALGASVIALWVGERLRPGDPSATRQVIAGIVTVEIAELFPLVGWIVVPLLCVSTGLGAVILALFQPRKVAQ
jgi:NO-binding membrane sensor protein with MHYT domain